MRSTRGRPWVDALLRVPLGVKLVTASVVVAALVAAPLLFLRPALGARVPDLVLLTGTFVLGALLLALLNGLLVRLALRPIRELERAAARVEAGDLTARAEPTRFADGRLRRVVELFNGALDGICGLRSRLRSVARRAVARRETERRETASRLQEDVAQRIAACLLKLRAARGREESGARDALLDEVRDDAAAVLESVRRLARDLHPPELADLGVAHGIQAFARSFSESTGLEVEVELGDDPSGGAVPGAGLGEEARLALYRIAQDLLMSLVQRTEPAAVRMTLRREGDRVVLELRDPGSGSAGGAGPGRPAPWARGPEHLEIRERAAYVGGQVSIEEAASPPRVRVEIPRDPPGGPLAV